MTEVELRKLDDEMVAAFVASDIDRILSHCSDDVLMHDFGAEPVQGKEAARQYLADQFGAISAEKATHIKRIFDENQVFGELNWTATNTGDIPMPDGTSIPATGKTITQRLAYYARVNDAGEVAEIRSYQDIADMMGQLGLMPG